MKLRGSTNTGIQDIRNYRLPITAISSLLHRISGLVMVLLLPFLLWGFSISLNCPNDFAYIQHLATSSAWSIMSWLFLVAISYHIFAGIRHIIMDFGFAEELEIAQKSSVLVLILGSISVVFWGVWLWLV